MKAIVWTKYGSADGLILKDVPIPKAKKNEVLIRVKATTVTAGDCEMRSLKLPFLLNIVLRIIFGLRKPRNIILGQEFAGEIVSLGENTTRFKVKDKVFGTTGFKFGAYAEYICLPENAKDKALITLPNNISFDEAAGVPVGGLEALHFFRKADIKKGEKVLVNGAAGSIGTFAIQLYKRKGAVVTGVDTYQKFDTMKSVGADYVIDYKKEDFTKTGERYDVVFDVVGKSVYKSTLACLNPNGRYMLANPKLLDLIKGSLFNKRQGKKVIYGSAEHNNEDLKYLKDLIETDELRPIIDKKMTLDEVRAAHEYVEKGLKKGNLIITL